jgi:hypothetical protein
MTRRAAFTVIWFAFALAWVLPVHKDGVRLPEGVPGWEAFRFAAAPVWPYEGVESETWWGATLSSLSAATNLGMLASLAIGLAGARRNRAAGIAAIAAFVVNAQWLFMYTDWVDLRPGYYLWWLSFLGLGLLSLGVGARASAPSLKDAAA